MPAFWLTLNSQSAGVGDAAPHTALWPGAWPPRRPLVPGAALHLPAAPLPPSLWVEGLWGDREQRAVGHRCDRPPLDPHRPAKPAGWPCCDTVPRPVGQGQSPGKVTVRRGPRVLGVFQLDLRASAFCRLSPKRLSGWQRGPEADGERGPCYLAPRPPPGLSSSPHS